MHNDGDTLIIMLTCLSELFSFKLSITCLYGFNFICNLENYDVTPLLIVNMILISPFAKLDYMLNLFTLYLYL